MFLAFGRPWRRLLATSFALLIGLVAAERRAFELDFGWSAERQWENNEDPEGDEILNRLVLVADPVSPPVPVLGPAPTVAALDTDAQRASVDRPTPRAPPQA